MICLNNLFTDMRLKIEPKMHRPENISTDTDCSISETFKKSLQILASGTHENPGAIKIRNLSSLSEMNRLANTNSSYRHELGNSLKNSVPDAMYLDYENNFVNRNEEVSLQSPNCLLPPHYFSTGSINSHGHRKSFPNIQSQGNYDVYQRIIYSDNPSYDKQICKSFNEIEGLAEPLATGTDKQIGVRVANYELLTDKIEHNFNMYGNSEIESKSNQANYPLNDSHKNPVSPIHFGADSCLNKDYRSNINYASASESYESMKNISSLKSYDKRTYDTLPGILKSGSDAASYIQEDPTMDQAFMTANSDLNQQYSINSPFQQHLIKPSFGRSEDTLLFRYSNAYSASKMHANNIGSTDAQDKPEQPLESDESHSKSFGKRKQKAKITTGRQYL